MASGSAYRVLSILDEEPVVIEGGELDWVPLRRRLGISAFGTNAYRAERAGDRVIEDHVESPGQEELYVVLSGRVRMRIGDEVVEAGAGTAVFLPDPAVRRGGEALQDGTAVLAVGGWPGEAYRSLPWEPIYLAQDAMLAGDWAAAAETLEREAGDHRRTAIVQYRLACCHARLGDADRAFAELAGAFEVNDAMRGRARGEEHLEALHDDPRWGELVGPAG